MREDRLTHEGPPSVDIGLVEILPQPVAGAIATPHVVHQQVEAPLLARDAGEEGDDLRFHRVIDADGDARAAGRRDQFCGFFDGLRPGER